MGKQTSSLLVRLFEGDLSPSFGTKKVHRLKCANLNATWRIGNSPEKRDSVCRLGLMPRMNEVEEVAGSNPAVAIYN